MTYLTKSGISNFYYNAMKNITLQPPCPNFPQINLIKLFIQMKIFYTMKYANKEVQEDKMKIKYGKTNILSHL